MRLLTTLSLLILGFSATAFAQFPLSVGVKAGVPLTDSFESTNVAPGLNRYSDSRNYLVGPMVELRLPFHLAVEADALYRPLNLATRPAGAVGNTSSSNYSTWEFPILAKYYFHPRFVKPYVEAGPSFRKVSDGIGALSDHGVTIGVGLDVGFIVHVSPEFRYTHWAADSSFSTGIPAYASKQNQVEFLVGFSF